MMNNPHTKNELLDELRTVQRSVGENIRAMTESQFNTGTEQSWSAAGYVKHLILSIKPVAKAMSLPLERLQSMFGQSDRPTRTYDELVAAYQARLAEGIRAEDFDRVTPGFYRFPEGSTDEKEHLTQTWDESNQRLLTALEQWDETALDSYQLPHPAIGMVTAREMVYFTLFHNRLHGQDIREAGGVGV
jgi:DinB superfamily